MARLKRVKVWLTVLAGLAFSSAGWSDGSVPMGYQSVAAEHGIPATVLYAVALTETGKPVEPAGHPQS